MEQLSHELDFVLGDLWAIIYRAVNTNNTIPPLKKEIEVIIESRVLKKFFKLDFIQVEHFRTTKGIRACITFTKKGQEYCNKYHGTSRIVI